MPLTHTHTLENDSVGANRHHRQHQFRQQHYPNQHHQFHHFHCHHGIITIIAILFTIAVNINIIIVIITVIVMMMMVITIIITAIIIITTIIIIIAIIGIVAVIVIIISSIIITIVISIIFISMISLVAELLLCLLASSHCDPSWRRLLKALRDDDLDLIRWTGLSWPIPELFRHLVRLVGPPVHVQRPACREVSHLDWPLLWEAAQTLPDSVESDDVLRLLFDMDKISLVHLVNDECFGGVLFTSLIKL
eukprot:s3455_g1.t1